MMNLESYFSFNPTDLSNSSIQYSNSLVPEWKILKDTKNVSFVVSYLVSHDQLNGRISLENEINTHLYKPTYFYGDPNKKQIICYVASEDILLHTIKHLSKIAAHLKIQSQITFEIKNEDVLLDDLIGDWTISDNVIFCNLASTCNFITYKYLLESNSISSQDFHELSVHIEMQRLGIKTECNSDLVHLMENSKNQIGFKEQLTKSKFFSSTNFFLGKKPVTLIQLPWGTNMATHISQAIAKKASSISFLGIIGGIGCNGKTDIEIDSCYFPNEVIDPYTTFRCQIDSNRGLQNSVFLKPWTSGNLTTLRPLKNINHMVTHASGLIKDQITAVDMEAAHILSSFSPFIKKVSLAYYVMDLDQDGKRFGDTYYSESFLTSLFKNSSRGKYFAMDTVIEALKNN